MFEVQSIQFSWLHIEIAQFGFIFSMKVWKNAQVWKNFNNLDFELNDFLLFHFDDLRDFYEFVLSTSSFSSWSFSPLLFYLFIYDTLAQVSNTKCFHHWNREKMHKIDLLLLRSFNWNSVFEALTLDNGPFTIYCKPKSHSIQMLTKKRKNQRSRAKEKERKKERHFKKLAELKSFDMM